MQARLVGRGATEDRPGEPVKCNQCNRPLPERYGYRNCEPCRERIALHAKDPDAYLASRPVRLGLAPDAPLRVLWVTGKGAVVNRKVGRIPYCWVSPSTCPPSCALFGKGCYAEHGFQRHHWSKVADRGITWDELVERVAELDAGQLWRYGVAGDLPGIGDVLDAGKLIGLARANGRAGARGFGFTHKPLRSYAEQAAVRASTAEHSFTVNLSANSPADADRLAARGLGPVVTVLPEDYPRKGTTPKGLPIVVCPAERRDDVTCARCGLCQKADRNVVVGFRAHGTLKSMANAMARGKS